MKESKLHTQKLESKLHTQKLYCFDGNLIDQDRYLCWINNQEKTITLLYQNKEQIRDNKVQNLCSGSYFNLTFETLRKIYKIYDKIKRYDDFEESLAIDEDGISISNTKYEGETGIRIGTTIYICIVDNACEDINVDFDRDQFIEIICTLKEEIGEE